MKLVRINGNESITLAEIRGKNVVYLHPTIQRVIDLQKCIVLCPLRPIIDQFGSSKVPIDHPEWAKAVKLYLDFDWVSKAPNLHKWINREDQITLLQN